MKQQKITIWKEKEYDYPMALGFVPNLMTYLHEDDQTRPCMLVVPGGGYCFVAPSEGECVAKKFCTKGYQAFVLTYTVNPLMNAPLKDQPMKDLSRAIRYIRKHAQEFHIDPERLVICGFSAGAHLCGSICVHHDDVKDLSGEYDGISNRPDAAVLSYPVITSGEKAHVGSFCALLGSQRDPVTGESRCTASEEELDYMSLENHVTADTPPCFLWQTVTDETVPVENSYLFAEACRKKGVFHAHHVFSHGRHGLSLADADWAAQRYGEPYTMEQTMNLLQAVREDRFPLPEAVKGEFLKWFDAPQDTGAEDMAPNEEVAVWPELAEAWLKSLFHQHLRLFHVK